MEKLSKQIEFLLSEREALVKQLLGLEEIKRDIEAIDRLLVKQGYYANNALVGAKSQERSQQEPFLLEIPSEYNFHLTWEDKCLFILNMGGNLYASEVAEKLKELEPEMDIEKAEGRCAHSLSKLYRAGKIKVVGKTGKKFKYSL